MKKLSLVVLLIAGGFVVSNPTTWKYIVAAPDWQKIVGSIVLYFIIGYISFICSIYYFVRANYADDEIMLFTTLLFFIWPIVVPVFLVLHFGDKVGNRMREYVKSTREKNKE